MTVNKDEAAEKANESLRQVLESTQRLKESIAAAKGPNQFYLDNEVKRKIVEVYNYMAQHNVKKMGTQFENGIRFSCEIDDSGWKDRPAVVIDE